MKSLKECYEAAKGIFIELNEDLRENYHKGFEEIGLTMTGNMLKLTSGFGLGYLVGSVVSRDLEPLSLYLMIILTLDLLALGADVFYKISDHLIQYEIDTTDV